MKMISFSFNVNKTQNKSLEPGVFWEEDLVFSNFSPFSWQHVEGTVLIGRNHPPIQWKDRQASSVAWNLMTESSTNDFHSD